MAEIALAERGPLDHTLHPGRHGRTEGNAGVILRVLDGSALTVLLGSRRTDDRLRSAAASAGAALPDAGKVIANAAGFAVLWSGPDQWLVYADGASHAASQRFVEAVRASVAVVDASDGRVVVEVAGPEARRALAKGVPVDLHPRSFQPGTTALTLAAGMAVQIWQVDETPTYRVFVHRSFADAFWQWLVDAAAEYGVEVLKPSPR